MQKFSILWASALILFFGGCTANHYSISSPKVITIKTPKLKFSDTGYIRYEGDAVEVELFTAGLAVEKISIDEKVCVSAGCMSEETFTKEYLYEGYPKDTMRRILQGEPIFGGKGKDGTCGGALFQFIRNDDMDIMYRRKGGEIFFKDRLNGLMIKINELEDTNETK
ncbi:MAG: hypothetical protein Q8M39_10735 [Sulfuricurvum sp.]|nr:hypothetical protein [Sulfuricurvum sp.]